MTSMHPSDRHYRNTTVRISDLAVVTDVLHDVTFENCQIEGPAVVALMNSNLNGCSLEGDPDAIFWVIPDERDNVIGAIGLDRCTLVGCVLRRIGLAVPARELAVFKQGFGLT